MNGPRVAWTYLVDTLGQNPVEGILVDRSSYPVSIQLICKGRDEWLDNVSVRQVRRLSEQGKLPVHVVNYLTKTGLIGEEPPA